VAGFMLGHALVLAPFLDWMTATPGLLAQTYPVFRGSAGHVGLTMFYAVAAAEVLASWLFLAMAVITGRQRPAASVAALAGTGWIVLHYASGFAAIEAAVLRTSTAPADLVRHFVVWNVPLHLVHAALLIVALGALLSVPLRTPPAVAGPGRFSAQRSARVSGRRVPPRPRPRVG
jgi:hypothetical protein